MSAAESKREWRQRKIAAGCCGLCGKPRGATGTSYLCRVHADKQAEYLRNRRRRVKGKSEWAIVFEGQ